MSTQFIGRVVGVAAGAALVACIGPGSYWVAGQLEDALDARANEALAAANIVAQVSMHGRQATVSADDPATSWAARAIVAEVPGIAEVIIAGAKPGGDQSTPGQPSESPNETSTSTSTIASPAQEPIPDVAPILFPGGSAQVTSAGQAQVDQIAALMLRRPELRATLTGHTDNGLTADERYALGYARAAAVRAALIERGVPADRISAESLADTQPIGDNSTEDGATKNRRVEIHLEVAGR